MSKVEITKPNGKWLINGKPYEEMDWIEQRVFNEFLYWKREHQKAKNP